MFPVITAERNLQNMNDEKNMTSAQNAQPKEWKKILKIVGNVFLWLFVAFALVVTILAFAAQRSSDGIPSIGGKCYMSVLSDSMNIKKTTDPEVVEQISQYEAKGFKKGDMIIVKKLTEQQKTELKVGDVISYHTDKINKGQEEINTHRIVEIVYNEKGEVYSYITQGDNREMSQTTDDPVQWQYVIAKYTGSRVPGLGGFLGFLQKPTGFLVIIVLPLVLFFGYEVFVFIKTLLSIKNSGKKVISSADEELIKQRAVEEYLRQQAAAKAAEEANQAQEQQEQPPEEPKE